jgi:hypothetical protein
VIAIKPENLDSWLDPQAHTLGDMKAILDDPVGAYYQHELVEKDAATQ